MNGLALPFAPNSSTEWSDDFLIVQRPHSNSKVDRAGKAIGGHRECPEEEFTESFWVLVQWRAFHGYALNAVSMTLKNRALAIDPEATLAQRPKRFNSIQAKLMRSPNMALTQMQDIAGCRAVVDTVGDAFRLKQRYENYADSFPDRGPHLIKSAIKNYILEPKPDGYRSIHLVLKYRTNKKESEHCNGLRVEVQIRSRLQHAWAMAVETASALTDQALKAGIGRDSWKEFFRLMSSAIAIKEHLPMVPGAPEDTIYRKIRRLASGVVPWAETNS